MACAKAMSAPMAGLKLHALICRNSPGLAWNTLALLASVPDPGLD